MQIEYSLLEGKQIEIDKWQTDDIDRFSKN